MKTKEDKQKFKRLKKEGKLKETYCKCGNNPNINYNYCLNCGGKQSHI